MKRAKARSPKALSLEVEPPHFCSRMGFIVVPQFAVGDPRHGVPEPNGGPGVYRVTFVLCVPGQNVYRRRADFDKALKEGDSLLAVPQGCARLVVYLQAAGADTGSIELTTNAGHRLSAAIVRVKARDLLTAEETAYDTTAAFLSYLSYLTDVPLDITSYQVSEETTGVTKAVFGMLGRARTFRGLPNDGNVVTADGYRRMFAAYREGLNATNVFYQALTFSKAIEGCRRIQFTRKRSKWAPPPLCFPSTIEEVEVDEPFREFFQPFLGKKFTKVIEHFRPLIRNAIAHLDPFQEVLDIDRFKEINACENAVPVLRYMARRLIACELEGVKDARDSA